MAKADFDPVEKLEQKTTRTAGAQRTKNEYIKQLNAETKALEDQLAKQAKIREQSYRKELLEYKKTHSKIEDIAKKEAKIEEERVIAEKKADTDRENLKIKQRKKVNKDLQKLDEIYLKEYAAASLNQKQELIRAENEEINNVLAGYKAKEAAGKKLTTRELADQAKKQKQLETNNKKDLAMTKAKADAEIKNVPLKQKLALVGEKSKQRDAALQSSQTQYDADIAAAKEQFSEGSDEYKAAFDAAGAAKDARDAAANAEAGGLASMGEGAMGEALGGLGELMGEGGILGTIGDVIGGISDAFDIFTKGPQAIMVKAIMAILKVINGISKAVTQGIEQYAELQASYLAKVNTRLQGLPETNNTFQKLSAQFSDAFGANPYVSQKDLLTTLVSLTDRGIAYNLEQRAILENLSSKMVDTFSLLEDWITRSTRLQQADISAAALGSEAQLTQFLNTVFEDTSYLTDQYDSINSTLVEATSQMSAKDAASFLYNVNKWLGALYSVGMDEGVSTIAQGITALATADVEYFNGNDAARTLFAMASNGAYSDLLVNGVNATNVNQLLNNIVNYLAQITADTNQVTKNVKASVYGGLSLSDVRAASNLTANDISRISNSTITWASATSKVTDELLSFAESNVTASQMIDNFIDNMMLTVGETFVNATYGNNILNDALGVSGQSKYLGYKIGSMIGGTAGGLISGISILSEFSNIVGAIKNSMSKAISIDSNGSSLQAGIVKLSDLNAIDISDQALINERGQAYTRGAKGVLYGISTSTAIASNEYNSTYSNTMAQQAQQMANSRAVYEDTADNLVQDANDIYEELFEKQTAVRVILADVETTAQKNLTNQVYRVNENELVNVIDNISDTWSTLKGWFGRSNNNQVSVTDVANSSMDAIIL